MNSNDGVAVFHGMTLTTSALETANSTSIYSTYLFEGLRLPCAEATDKERIISTGRSAPPSVALKSRYLPEL